MQGICTLIFLNQQPDNIQIWSDKLVQSWAVNSLKNVRGFFALTTFCSCTLLTGSPPTSGRRLQITPEGYSAVLVVMPASCRPASSNHSQ